MATLSIAAKPEVATMQVAQISKPGADFEIVEREIPEPKAGEVRIRVQACGVCHSDALTKEGLWPGISIRVSPDMKWRGSLIKWEPAFPHGRRGSVWVSAGTAAMTGRVVNADAGILITAATCKFRVSAMTADTRNT